MSLLGQINLVHNVGRIRSVSGVPQYVRARTYDRLSQQFERPHHALGNRYRNPIARLYDRAIGLCMRMVRPLGRIEIVVKVRIREQQ